MSTTKLKFRKEIDVEEILYVIRIRTAGGYLLRSGAVGKRGSRWIDPRSVYRFMERKQEEGTLPSDCMLEITSYRKVKDALEGHPNRVFREFFNPGNKGLTQFPDIRGMAEI